MAGILGIHFCPPTTPGSGFPRKGVGGPAWPEPNTSSCGHAARRAGAPSFLRAGCQLAVSCLSKKFSVHQRQNHKPSPLSKNKFPKGKHLILIPQAFLFFPFKDFHPEIIFAHPSQKRKKKPTPPLAQMAAHSRILHLEVFISNISRNLSM